MTTPLELAEFGYRVFPLVPNTKIPPKGFIWPALATNDPKRVAGWFNGPYKGFNVGIACGNGLVVFDFDVAKGGLDSLFIMDMLGLPKGMRVKTPSGGVHVYLRTPLDADLSNSVNSSKNFPGVDVRHNGGYVVGPGSTLRGIAYEIIL